MTICLFIFAIFEGAQVVIACRDIQKAEDAAREISSETKNSVTTLKLDLASLSSIRTAAQNLKVQQPKIHLLINNAGKIIKRKQVVSNFTNINFQGSWYALNGRRKTILKCNWALIIWGIFYGRLCYSYN